MTDWIFVGGITLCGLGATTASILLTKQALETSSPTLPIAILSMIGSILILYWGMSKIVKQEESK